MASCKVASDAGLLNALQTEVIHGDLPFSRASRRSRGALRVLPRDERERTSAGNADTRKALGIKLGVGPRPPIDRRNPIPVPNGIARVETKQSFLDMLVSLITLSIYTPMYIQSHAPAPDRRWRKPNGANS